MQLSKLPRYGLALIAALLPAAMSAQTVPVDPLSGVWEQKCGSDCLCKVT
jgi:hypothetical protein